MDITVAICTRNRAEALAETLKCLASHIAGERVSLEVLVVDNGSTDTTQQVLASAAAFLPLRSLTEETPGASHARNRALREAAGDYILWIDDDVLVCDGWLDAYRDAFRTWPQASFFGGAIEPLFLGTPPPWIVRAGGSLDGVFAVREFGAEAIPLTPKRVPFGANMAMRRAHQTRYGYDVRLGPAPGRAFGGEETDLIRRMLADGLEGWWVPGARVRHVIPPARQTTKYIRTYYRGYGESLVDGPQPGRRLFGRPAWAFRQAAVAEVQYWLRRVLSGPEVWVPHLVDASVARGMLAGSGHGRDAVRQRVSPIG